MRDLSKDEGPGTIHDPMGSALCDLGAYVNLMPTSILDKLRIGDIKPTYTILQMEDRSIKHPQVFMNGVLVKVGKFTFSVDFYILDIEVDREIPIILGWSFLATDERT